ncbi:MAG: protein kinase [Polyangiaceae bacterium]|nr:protein kinase [Polyangiaceae bacterium]
MYQSALLELPHVEDVIRGKYRLLRLIGEGGMGVVYEAVHLGLRQRVAIKLLHPSRRAERDMERFLREGRAASQLQSQHVTRVLDVDTLPNGIPFLVMELLEGCDLETELRIRGRLEISESVDYVLQACDALREAHARGIVHRDLKPSNLFLCDHGDERVLKVLDFGISKVVDEPNVTVTHTALGTPLYMSPEQIRNSKDVDHRSDVWSLGVILFELLAGRPPFEGAATAVSVAIAVDPPPWLSTLRPEVPPDLERTIARALEKDLSLRFCSVVELVEALRPLASDPAYPGHVRISSLPRAMAALPLRSRRPTATTLSAKPRANTAWTTRVGERRPRLALYTAAAGGVVFMGAVVALALNTAARSGSTSRHLEDGRASVSASASAMSVLPSASARTDGPASEPSSHATPAPILSVKRKPAAPPRAFRPVAPAVGSVAPAAASARPEADAQLAHPVDVPRNRWIPPHI